MLTIDEMDALTRKLWSECDPGEDPYCCTPMRHNVISAIRAACGLRELGERESTNPVMDVFRVKRDGD